jgi:3-methyladenine DNA glycosylase AlkC
MATELKLLINDSVVCDIAKKLKRVHPAFNTSRFITEVCADLAALPLLARAHRIAKGLREYLPKDFAQAIHILLKCLDENVNKPDGFYGFEYLPFLNFVGDFGVDHPHVSLDAMTRMTCVFSAEWDVRPFLIKHKALTLRCAHDWAKNADWRVRRLASEGTRPRLPWGIRLREFIEDPEPVLDILELLRADPNLIVRRSVANNLNDIAKDHPERVLSVAKRWWKTGSTETRWIVRHGLRTLTKKGNAAALSLLGFSGGRGISISAFRLAADKVAINDALDFSCQMASKESSPSMLSIKYCIHYRRANGKLSPKIFNLSRRELLPNEKVMLRRRHSFAPISTRRFYPGKHAVELLVNGQSLGRREFTLLPQLQ